MCGGGEDPGTEQHGGAGAKNQRPGQSNRRICPRGRVSERAEGFNDIIKCCCE